MDAYREINKEVCQELAIQYVDLRQAFKSELPSAWPFSRWYLTSDGEHPNERGSQIIANKFVEVLKKWMPYFSFVEFPI